MNTLLKSSFFFLSIALLLVPQAYAQHCHSKTPDAETAPTKGTSDLQVPSVEVIDQAGQRVDFRQLVEDKVVAINFVFTTCTTVCPPMGANFGKLQELLGERSGRDVHLLSVSIDPAVDTPGRLQEWSRKFGAGPGWTLVTGSKPSIDGLLKSLGVFIADKQLHSPVALLGNARAGVWRRTNGLTPADEMLRQLEELVTFSEDEVSTEEVAR